MRLAESTRHRVEVRIDAKTMRTMRSVCEAHNVSQTTVIEVGILVVGVLTETENQAFLDRIAPGVDAVEQVKAAMALLRSTVTKGEGING